MIIDKKAHKGNGQLLEYEKDVHDICFLDPQELYNNLNDRRSFDFNTACFKRLKDFITKSQPSDYSKPGVFKALYGYLEQLYRKLNVRNTMSHQFN